MVRRIARDLESGVRSFSSTTAGKAVLVETLLAAGIVVWVSLRSAGTQTQGERALVGLALIGTVLVLSSTLMFLDGRHIRDFAIFGIVPLGAFVAVVGLTHYAINGLTLPPQSYARYTNAVFIGWELCVVSGLVGMVLHAIVSRFVAVDDDRSPEERVLGDDIDDFDDL